MEAKDVYGWRARIGLMVPSGNTVAEAEFNAMRPKGFSVHVARIFLAEGTAKGLERMAEDTERAAELLATAGVDVIAYTCTTGSLVKGPGWDQELIKRIEKISGAPATTTATAVINAFRELNVSKVAVATPYNEELNQLEVDFFEANGIKVLNMKGLDLDLEGMYRADPETIYQLAGEVNSPQADAVFLSCTNFKAITLVERLEKELQKPVFSSNIATMWGILRRLGLREQIEGYGTLLRMV